MTQQSTSRRFKKIIVAGLTIALALSANVAWAGHQLVNEGSVNKELNPTELAGKATGQIELQIETEGSDSQGEDGSQTPNGSSQPDGDGTTEPDGEDSPHPDNENGFDHPNGRPESPPTPPLAPKDQGLGLNGTDDLANGQSVVTGNIQIEDLENTDNVEVFLVDKDGDRSVSLGKVTDVSDSVLEGDLSATVDNVEEFDSVVVTRQSTDNSDDGPSSDVLFSVELPHDQ